MPLNYSNQPSPQCYLSALSLGLLRCIRRDCQLSLSVFSSHLRLNKDQMRKFNSYLPSSQSHLKGRSHCRKYYTPQLPHFPQLSYYLYWNSLSSIITALTTSSSFSLPLLQKYYESFGALASNSLSRYLFISINHLFSNIKYLNCVIYLGFSFQLFNFIS